MSNSELLHPKTINLFREFQQLCVGHDWYYSKSDDHREWKKGVAEEAEITRLFKDLSEMGLYEGAREIYKLASPGAQ